MLLISTYFSARLDSVTMKVVATFLIFFCIRASYSLAVPSNSTMPGKFSTDVGKGEIILSEMLS